jgi:ADP-ribose pyrophosphatase YjhB (NUDIX family)
MTRPRALAAAAAVRRDDGLLLIRRRDLGTWELPGGHVEAGESFWDAAVRECAEECGVTVTAASLVGAYHRPRRDGYVFVIGCIWTAGEPSPSEEAVDAGWFGRDALPEPMVPVVRERVSDVFAGRLGVFRQQTEDGNETLREPSLPSAGTTRPTAFVFIRSPRFVLISEMVDEVEGRFYRPPGGGLEFGETAADAARRELKEELDLRVGDLDLLGVLENIFDFRGVPCHEICFVFGATVDDDTLKHLDGRSIVDETSVGGSEHARVISHDELRRRVPLYPDGVIELLG